MQEDQFEEALKRCLKAMDELPEPKKKELKKLVEETRLRHDHIQQSLSKALTALDDWRVYQKYRLFDREAKNREDQNNPQPPDKPVEP